nr:PREDICTED: uncharacterized protein LOC102363447 [Latimeria chalumnae]|eukprot:XP_006010337.1 PREDICTED: uncharacterized protein LOC102363447 [Latimeria chalumnae]
MEERAIHMNHWIPERETFHIKEEITEGEAIQIKEEIPKDELSHMNEGSFEDEPSHPTKMPEEAVHIKQEIFEEGSVCTVPESIRTKEEISEQDAVCVKGEARGLDGIHVIELFPNQESGFFRERNHEQESVALNRRNRELDSGESVDIVKKIPGFATSTNSLKKVSDCQIMATPAHAAKSAVPPTAALVPAPGLGPAPAPDLPESREQEDPAHPRKKRAFLMWWFLGGRELCPGVPWAHLGLATVSVQVEVPEGSVLQRPPCPRIPRDG